MMCSVHSLGQLLFRSLAAIPIVAAVTPTHNATPSPQWPQWGGVNRDFRIDAAGLADRWTDEGPRRLWARPLGEGYSAIVADATRLYTMYRKGETEIVVAVRPDGGETLWEHRYRAPAHPDQTADFGQGPSATPLLMGDRLVTVGFTGILHCLDAASGSPLWSYDLVKQFKGAIQYYGYANSPIAYHGNVIILVGGKDHGVVALDPDSGKLTWKSRSFDISYAAPILINVDGQDQLVFFSPTEIIGIDPSNGAYLWSHKVINFCRTNCTQAIWGEDNLLWAATKGVGGTRVLRLKQENGKTEVKEVWVNRKAKIYHWNAVRIGDHVYTSIGDSEKFLSAIDIKTGELKQRIRGFGSTNGIYADNKLILLDDGGKLLLAGVDGGKIEIVSTAQVTDSLTWTVPTLVNNTLFLRDRKNLMAFDLGDKP